MRICSIGECMIEFSNTEKDIFKLGYAGDTANSAIYLSRLGANSSYITTLGEDYLSKNMINFLKKENVKTHNIHFNKNKTVGQSLGISGDGKNKFEKEISKENKTIDQTYKNIKEKLKKKDGN